MTHYHNSSPKSDYHASKINLFRLFITRTALILELTPGFSTIPKHSQGTVNLYFCRTAFLDLLVIHINVMKVSGRHIFHNFCESDA